MPATLATLEQRRVELKARIEKLTADNPATASAPLDAQLGPDADKAAEAMQAYAALRKLETQIAAMKDHAETETFEAQVRKHQEQVFEDIKPGDRIDIGGNCLAQVIRKNRKSVTTMGGSRYTPYEIYGVEHRLTV